MMKRTNSSGLIGLSLLLASHDFAVVHPITPDNILTFLQSLPPDKPPQTYNSNTPAAKAGPGNPHTHTKHSSPQIPGGSSPAPRVTAPQKNA